MKCVAIVPAAGRGTRMQLSHSKLAIELGGATVLQHTVQRLLTAEAVDSIYVCVNSDDADTFRADLASFRGIHFVKGGETRRESVANALEAIAASTDIPEIVLVHDGARCCIEPELVREVVAATHEHGAATAAVRVTDTLKRELPGPFVGDSIDREQLWRIQTPQGFEFPLLLEAHRRFSARRKAGERVAEPTDDTSLVSGERNVAIVPGHGSNIKITTPDDLLLAQALIASTCDRSKR